MPKELIINASLPEVRIALMEDGRIQELLIERQSDKGIVGNIYKGRVTRVLPGMQAAFVDVGLDKAAFLYVDDIYVHPKVMGDAEIDDGDDEDAGDAPPPARVFTPKNEKSGETNEEGGDESLQASSENQETTQNTEEENAAAAEADAEFAAEAAAQLEDDEDEEGDDEEGNDEGSEESDSEEAEQLDTSSFESHAAEHAESELTDFENEDDSEDDSEEEDSEEDEEETLAAGSNEEGAGNAEENSENASEGGATEENAQAAPLQGLVQDAGGRRPRGRNRRRGRGKNRDQKNQNPRAQFAAGESFADPDNMPESMMGTLNDKGNVESDRAQMQGEGGMSAVAARPTRTRPEFREQRGRDRRIKSKHSKPRAQANIADLLKEGQEVIVQVAKDPIATKGARLTCHVSLPGRHLVCMPTIDHVGVSRRIERDDERRKLRDFVERNRPRNMGFIVRTASGGKDPESWIKQDIDYLSKLWTKIRTRADDVSAPAIVYEDLNSTLRAIRDWVNEDIDKIIVDSRYHYNELMDFADRFMPSLLDKIELYQGDIPIFDAYGLSSELHRSLERRVWLKSGGYIVIDQAEALVAIDVNTGRFVGKKNLEDTILKTNLEACEEIAYQLRLRNCGGIIICDFIDMERDDNRMRVYRALDEALKKDRARPTIQKISELGLVEMTRKRTRDTIIRTLCEPCVHCEGKGFGKSKQTVAYEILREVERLGVDRDSRKVLISAHESVVDILAIELRDVLDSLEKRYAKTVYLQSIIDFHAEQFEVVTDRMGNKKQSQDIARTLRVERERAERKEKQKQRSHKEPRESVSEDLDSQESGQQAAPARAARTPVPPVLPTKKAEGAFLIKPAPLIQPVERVAGEASTEENSGDEMIAQADEEFEGQPDVVIPAARPAPARRPDGTEDEDQLAYLRAQAAQDAALAYSGASPSAGAANQGRNQGRNQQGRNNRPQNNRGGRGGGRNDRGANDRGGGRGRPHQQRSPHRSGFSNSSIGHGAGGAIVGQGPQQNAQQSYSAHGQAPSSPKVDAPSVPDYEVLVKPDSDGSNS